MKILKVNELNSRTYLSAARKQDDKKKKYELIKYGYSKSNKLPGTYSMYDYVMDEPAICWIIPKINVSQGFNNKKVSLKILVEEKEKNDKDNFYIEPNATKTYDYRSSMYIEFVFFEFGNYDFSSAFDRSFQITFELVFKHKKEGSNLEINLESNYISSDALKRIKFNYREDAVRFISNLKNENFIQFLNVTDEEVRDIIYEYNIINKIKDLTIKSLRPSYLIRKYT